MSEKTLKNECFSIIDHSNNLILYTADEDDEILAHRIYDNNLINNPEKKNVNTENKSNTITDYGITALLGTAVAAGAYYLRK